MTTGPASAPVAVRRGPPELTWCTQLRSGWRRLHAVLLVGWLLLGLATLGVGERQSSFQTLEEQVQGGHVRDVRVVGASLEPGHGSFTTLEVHWRHDLIRHVAEVVEARSPAAARREGMSHASGTPVVRDVVARLLRDRPDLRITRTDGPLGSATARGWQVPSWLLGADLLAGLLTFWLLVSGPQPWRATRWAWFWLLGVAFPLGPLVFVALSGPTPRLPRPAMSAPRLTGGWAFLLALVLNSLWWL